MPYIDEKDLLELHDKIDKLEIEKDRTGDLSVSFKEDLDSEKKMGLIFKMVAGVFVVSTLVLGYFNFVGSSSDFSFDEDSQYAISKDSMNILLSAYDLYDNAYDNSLHSNSKIRYSVQVGSFKKYNLSLYSNNLKYVKEFKDGEYRKYTMGSFDSYVDAEKFRVGLDHMGFKDCFVMAIRNGIRVEMEIALELTNEMEYLKI
ncbi:MAG: hypothetical protein HRT66_00420 [Flavobacteriaceae bacterium]|nr:hypothetical protein [Flavobacteriaceae bacterium]